MGLKTETRVIDGLQVTCTQFACLRQYEILPRLAAVGPVLGLLDSGKPITDHPEAAVMLASALAAGDPTAARAVARELLAGCRVVVDGRATDLLDDDSVNRIFAGNLLASFRCILFSLEVNFGDFFAAASPPKAADELAQPPKAPAPSTSTRTFKRRGPAGDSSAPSE